MINQTGDMKHMNKKNIGLSVAAAAVALLVLSPVQTVQAQELPLEENILGGLITCAGLLQACINYCGPDAVFACYQSSTTSVYICRCL